MAILRSVDGMFYEVPDDDLDNFKVPPEQVKEKLGDAGGLPSGPPPGGGMGGGGAGGPGGMPGGGLVYVQVFSNTGGGPGPEGMAPAGAGACETGEEGEVEPYRFCGWRNWRNWRNCWRNWRNCC